MPQLTTVAHNPVDFMFCENGDPRELWLAHRAAPHLAACMRASESAVATLTLNETTQFSQVADQHLKAHTSRRKFMKVVALTHYLPVSNPNAFLDVDLPRPTALGRDLLVAVNAVSINPVDTKVRRPKDTAEKNAPRAGLGRQWRG